MSETNVHGPVDFVLIEFTGDRLTGRAAAELLDLVDRGIIRVYDVLLMGKTAEGEVYALDFAEGAGGFEDLAGARTGLLAEDDRMEAASAMQPGTLAALIVYENTWAIPFVAAARESGGEMIAGARIPAQDLMDVLDALEALDNLETTS